MSLLGAIASIAAMLTFLATALSDRFETPSITRRAELEQLRRMFEKQLSAAQRERTRAVRELQMTETELEHARSELARLRVIATSSSGDGRQLSVAVNELHSATERIQGFEQNLKQLDNRLQAMETAVIADPQKALATPLLRRDLEALQQLTSRDIESARAENARVYDLMKWLVGLMALVSLSLIGTAAGNVFKREQPAQKWHDGRSENPPAG